MQILNLFLLLFPLFMFLFSLEFPSGFSHSFKPVFISLLLNIFLPQSVSFIERRP